MMLRVKPLTGMLVVDLTRYLPGPFASRELLDAVVYCSLTGFGSEGPHVARAGHDLNYLGYAGVLADTAPALPPVQIADLGSGALAAIGEILAALLERERTGKGRRN